jgi:hypothetical protein
MNFNFLSLTFLWKNTPKGPFPQWKSLFLTSRLSQKFDFSEEIDRVMREKTFIEILSQRIEKDLKKELFPSENGNFSSEKSSLRTENRQEFPWISPLFRGETGFLETSKFNQKQNLHRFYPRPTCSSKIEKRTSHQLTEEQNLAWNYFLKWKSGLTLDFTEKELKGAFRRLAQKLHPDRNAGQSTFYLELKKNFEILNQVFKVSSR